MTDHLDIRYYPLFEKGIFEKHPALFDWFICHTPDNLKQKYRKAQETLRKYEESITWPLIVAPGLYGATHPGAENVFHSIMVDPNGAIYNSDCLYINPSQRVYAVSDPPGMSTYSRKLFTKLDQHLHTESADNLETILNNLNREADTGDRATLSLLFLPKYTN